MIDLNKLGFLEVLAFLPMDFWIPDLIWFNELLSISRETKERLSSALQVMELDGTQVDCAQGLMSANLRLSFADCSALALAVANPQSILLCSDRLMRTTAEALNLEVHGIFWLFDQLADCGVVARHQILNALLAIQADPAIRLPKEVLSSYLARYR